VIKRRSDWPESDWPELFGLARTKDSAQRYQTILSAAILLVEVVGWERDYYLPMAAILSGQEGWTRWPRWAGGSGYVTTQTQHAGTVDNPPTLGWSRHIGQDGISLQNSLCKKIQEGGQKGYCVYRWKQTSDSTTPEKFWH